MDKDITTSIRINKELLEKIKKIAKSQNRSTNFMISEAIQHYVTYHECFCAEVQKALESEPVIFEDTLECAPVTADEMLENLNKMGL